MSVPRLEPGRTAVLLVDLQERLVPVMHEPDRLIAQAGRLLDGAAALRLPVLVTEQYPKGLGATLPELTPRLVEACCRDEKLAFSACTGSVREALRGQGARCVIVAGIEAHVCVLQTCMDLVDAGYVTALAVDVTSSRRPVDRDAAVQRMTQMGVLPTTVESALLELVREAGGAAFKAILPLMKTGK